MGKRTWLEELITHTYLPAIAKLKDTAKGRARMEQLTQQMRQDWTEQGLSQLTQQQGLMDRMRRAISDSRWGSGIYSSNIWITRMALWHRQSGCWSRRSGQKWRQGCRC